MAFLFVVVFLLVVVVVVSVFVLIVVDIFQFLYHGFGRKFCSTASHLIELKPSAASNGIRCIRIHFATTGNSRPPSLPPSPPPFCHKFTQIHTAASVRPVPPPKASRTDYLPAHLCVRLTLANFHHKTPTKWRRWEGDSCALFINATKKERRGKAKARQTRKTDKSQSKVKKRMKPKKERKEKR